MKKELIAMAAVAEEFEKQGNLKAGRIITDAMQKIAHCGHCEEDQEKHYGHSREEFIEQLLRWTKIPFGILKMIPYKELARLYFMINGEEVPI